jgi:hypothetical protein
MPASSAGRYFKRRIPGRTAPGPISREDASQGDRSARAQCRPKPHRRRFRRKRGLRASPDPIGFVRVRCHGSINRSLRRVADPVLRQRPAGGPPWGHEHRNWARSRAQSTTAGLCLGRRAVPGSGSPLSGRCAGRNPAARGGARVRPVPHAAFRGALALRSIPAMRRSVWAERGGWLPAWLADERSPGSKNGHSPCTKPSSPRITVMPSRALR